MGAIEDKYFHRPAGEITLLPPIDIDPRADGADRDRHAISRRPCGARRGRRTGKAPSGLHRLLRGAARHGGARYPPPARTRPRHGPRSDPRGGGLRLPGSARLQQAHAELDPRPAGALGHGRLLLGAITHLPNSGGADARRGRDRVPEAEFWRLQQHQLREPAARDGDRHPARHRLRHQLLRRDDGARRGGPGIRCGGDRRGRWRASARSLTTRRWPLCGAASPP